MKHFIYVLLLSGLGCLGACKTKLETVVVQLPMLRPSSIYVADSVLRHQSKITEQRTELAAAYREKAEAIAGRNLPKALFYAKRAVSLHPTEELYGYLAGLLQKSGHLTELKQLYGLLFHETQANPNGEPTFLFGKPSKDTFYEFLVAEIKTDDFFYGQCQYYSSRLNYPLAELKDKLLADARVPLNRESRDFKNMMLYFMTDAEIKAYTTSEANFRNFLASIPDTAAVFTLDEKAVQTFAYDKSAAELEEGMDIAQFYSNYLEEQQQHPDNWLTFDIKRLVHLPDGLKAVLYAVDTSATGCPAEMRHIYHKLATYTPKGQLIATEVVATQAGESLALLQFTKNRFTITDHKRTWQQPYRKDDFDNRLLKTELTGERRYVITPEGKIVRETVLATKADSTAVEN